MAVTPLMMTPPQSAGNSHGSTNARKDGLSDPMPRRQDRYFRHLLARTTSALRDCQVPSPRRSGRRGWLCNREIGA